MRCLCLIQANVCKKFPVGWDAAAAFRLLGAIRSETAKHSSLDSLLSVDRNDDAGRWFLFVLSASVNSPPFCLGSGRCVVSKLWISHYQLCEFCMTIPLLLPAWLGRYSFVNTNFTKLTTKITKSNGNISYVI